MVRLYSNLVTNEIIEFKNIKDLKKYFLDCLKDELFLQLNQIPILQVDRYLVQTNKYLNSEVFHQHKSISDFENSPYYGYIRDEFSARIKFLKDKSLYCFLKVEQENYAIDTKDIVQLGHWVIGNRVEPTELSEVLYMKYKFRGKYNIAEFDDIEAFVRDKKKSIESMHENASEVETQVIKLNRDMATLLEASEYGEKEREVKFKNLFDGLEKSYRQKLKLEAPRKHWEEASQKYNNKFKIFFILFISIVLLAIMFITVLYFNGVFENFSLETSVFIRVSVFITAILSFVFFILTNVLKVALNFLHLSQDAQERILLIDTLQSMISEGGEKNIVNEEHTKIIIQAIYARTESGLMKNSDIVIPFLNRS